MSEPSRNPTADPAEHNAFFPSPYSLSLYIPSKTDFDGVKFDKPYTGGRYKILVVASDERYLLTQNGTMFSTGNHPVETLLPMLHINKAGFELEVATLSGNPVKLEMWAMPKEDEAVKTIYEQYLPKFKEPKKLANILAEVTQDDSGYLGVFIPGGHAALIGLPQSRELKAVLEWAMAKNRFVISLCHGPAGLLAAAVDTDGSDYLFKGYEMAVFPDSLDEGANVDIGYISGRLPWLLGEKLESLGVKIVSPKDTINGMVHQDRNVLTGDSPLAANALGILAANTLLECIK